MPVLCLLLCQAEECLRLEEERVDNYLHTSTKPKLLKQVTQLHPPERISLVSPVCQGGGGCLSFSGRAVAVQLLSGGSLTHSITQSPIPSLRVTHAYT